MEGGPPGFTRSSTGFVLLWDTSSTESFGLYVRDCHPLWSTFPGRSVCRAFVTPLRARNPGPKTGLGYIRFRSPLLTESRLISFPPGTEMFQFPGSAPTCYEFTRR